MFAFLAAGSLALTSCSDDDGDNGPAPTLEGRWYYSQEGVSAMGVESLQPYDDHENGCTKDYIELLADGVTKDRDYYNTTCEFSEEVSTWAAANNTITVGTGTDAITFNILALDNNTLKVGLPQSAGGTTGYYVTVFTRN